MNSKSTTDRNVTKNDEHSNNYSEFGDKLMVNPDELPIKVYEARDSMLTTMLADKHIRTFYYLYLTLLVYSGITTVAYEALYKEQFYFGISPILHGFVNFHRFFVIWICMFLNSLLPYFGFKYWALLNIRMTRKNDTKVKQWNLFCLALFLVHCFCMLGLSTRVAVSWDLGMAVKPAVIMESIRFVMKNYAFVRSSAPNVLEYKNSKPVESCCPNFSHYLYFSFAPVLVYRDNYPRSQQKIRWSFVISCAFNFIAGIFLYNFFLQRSFIYDLQDYGLKEYSWKDILMIILQNVPYGFLLLANLCYTGIHSWFNGFAEMLGFSDRLFYKDWWTSTTDKRFLRTWNLVVHDWLYLYVYADLHKFVIHDRIVARLLTLFVVAAFHDYILSFSFGFCIPIYCYMYFSFIIASKLQFKNEIVGSVYFLYMVGFMPSTLATVYGMEYFARVNCPVDETGVYSYFKLRFLTCGN